MKSRCMPIAITAAVLLLVQTAVRPQDFVSGGAIPAAGGVPAAAASSTSSSFADGTRAINQERWNDAIAIFTKLANEAGDRADGALYWRAYAQNRLGNSEQALDTCTVLLHQYPESTWIDECGALKIEIRAKNGEPVPPSAEQSDELKLLALASLMHHDEKRALSQINDILNGDSSEKLKQGALFIMGQHNADMIDPQIARIRYVEGDVRISRGEDKASRKDSDWEQAVANLPLQTGYSLVTGTGRAEIELENDSTLYLGENSVLLFNNLFTFNGMPETEVSLLSGMATLHIVPGAPGEKFVLKTPTDMLSTRYPNGINLRVNSYMDGIGLTPLVASGIQTTGDGLETLAPGKTQYFKGGRPIVLAGPIHPPDYSSWDNWVADRYGQREKELAAALKSSGLTSPIPGLADLEKQGTFFPCQPYGTCWKPNAAATSGAGNALLASNPSPNSPNSQAEIAPADVQQAAPGSRVGFLGKPMPNVSPQTGPDFSAVDMMFPCMPDQIRYMLMMSSFPASPQMLNSALWYYGSPWQWAVCHAGSWIYLNNMYGGNGGYVWVAGRTIHQMPFHWIRSGRTLGFVPVHPYDIKGRTPVNDRNGVFSLNASGREHSIWRVALQPGRKVEVLNGPPRAFRTDFVSPLARAAEPHMMGHEIKDLGAAREGLARSTGIPITFDHRSQTFMTSRDVIQGGRTVSISAPVGGAMGGLQNRGFYGGGANPGSSAGWRQGSNAGSSGAAWRGGSPAGEGPRGGAQGMGPSGGGFHGGGGNAGLASSSMGHAGSSGASTAGSSRGGSSSGASGHR